jgi:hypothetical protein
MEEEGPHIHGINALELFLKNTFMVLSCKKYEFDHLSSITSVLAGNLSQA